ncbi:GNAT family N-acetyltransferase [Phenylobacterium sp.]|uniref:GNAT family N-acetyltransferase n=1 Tax=Phenylobacterium sp. TaxID=1871053 RepID=UPI0035B17C76
MNLEARVLEDRFVRLEPMAERHKAELRAAVEADLDVWTRLYPYSWAGEHFEPTWTKLMDDVAGGRTLAWAVAVGGACRGLSTYYAIDGANAVLEIGGTYYEPSLRGGPVNPAAKRLLLAHAFDAGCRRAVFRVDASNARSRAAVLKLGAVQEGILRQDRVTWTGRIRDTVIFSILDGEWPAVRARLDARLAAFG